MPGRLLGYGNGIPHPGPPRHRLPVTDGSELHVHPQRTPRDITASERVLVRIFLLRYVRRCARARHSNRMRDALELFAEIRPPPKRYRVIEARGL